MQKKIIQNFLTVFCFAAFSLTFSAALNAADESTRISVKAEVNKAFITIGEPVQYSVTIRHAPAIQVLSSVPAPPDDILKIKKVEDINRKDEDGQIHEGRRFTLTTFKLGQFVLDPVEIQYRAGSDPVVTIKTDPIYITVKSVAEGEEKTDIRGIKSVMAILQKNRWWLLAVLALLAFTPLYFVFFRKKQAEVSKEPEPTRTPDEEALFQLNQLFDSDLLRRGKVKEYFLRLSEILRTYFERRYQILAVESTTYEILRDLKEKQIDKALLEKIDQVLDSADLAKFAKWKPEPPQIVVLNQKSRQIIESSRESAPHGV